MRTALLLFMTVLFACDDGAGIEAAPGTTPPTAPTPAAQPEMAEKPPRKTGAIPTDEADLRKYLLEGGYKKFVVGNKVVGAAGHGPARTFFNPLLLESIKQGNTEHPIGAGSVKELLNVDDSLFGWTVSVKTAAGQGGHGWFWFEVQDTKPGAPATASGNGAGACVRCHISGNDLVHAVPPT